MQESTIEIRIPQSLLEYGIRPEDVQQRVAEWLALSLFTEGHISSGKAASLLGISRVDFLALLHRRGVAYIDYTPDELSEELTAAGKLARARKE